MEFLYSLLLTSVVYNIIHVKPLSIMVIIMVNVAQRKLPSQKKKKISSVCQHKNFNHQPDHICLSVDKWTQICSIRLQ